MGSTDVKKKNRNQGEKKEKEEVHLATGTVRWL